MAQCPIDACEGSWSSRGIVSGAVSHEAKWTAIVTELVFEADEFDWALGELLELFDRAVEAGVYPHALDPVLFYDAWSLLCEQPFPVAQRWHKILTSKVSLGLGLWSNLLSWIELDERNPADSSEASHRDTV